jgi:cation-transporting ATPase E
MNDEAEINQALAQQGLTEQEVAKRRAAGQGNNVRLQTSRSYAQIFRENLFTFINGVFFAISIVMILLGRIGDAFLVVVVIFGGALINIYQEIWAKRKLDEIALLSRPTASVIREGRETHIDPAEIVLDDILLIRPGDQIVVDGEIVGPGRIEVDESLLTGESDLIVKQSGDSVYSGSFCVSGLAHYQARQVGTETIAYKLMSGARSFRQSLTPLQQEINLVIRVFVLIACFLWILVGISFVSRDYSINDLAQRAAVVAGLVPAGLLLAITLAYGLGAVRMLGQDVLIQQSNAVESLSNVNVLCLDKTGTLTTNRLRLQEVYPIGLSEAELRSLLGDYAASTTSGNRTSDALALSCPGTVHPLINEIPFSSNRKWSALAFQRRTELVLEDCNTRISREINGSPCFQSALLHPTLPVAHPLVQGIYVLGAPEVLATVTSLTAEALDYIKAGTEQGLRVVMFAYSPAVNHLKSVSSPQLPPQLEPLGILRFSDELRPEVRHTLAGFANAEIDIKIISGDHPQTVSALAKQAGLSADIKVISGPELARLDDVQFDRAAATHTIFGRITPEQKAKLVESLRRSGCYVAMIGDGVNDVLSLKRANLAIAMESGSKATRSVADIVLLKDSFAALPHTFSEGQRIRNGIQDVLKLFMIRTLCVTLLIFATAIVTDSFPLENKQSAIVSLIGVGLPTMVIPIWAKPGPIPQRSLVRSMLHFIVPSTLTITMVALLIYLYYLVVAILDLPPGAGLTQVNYSIPRTALVTVLVWCQLFLLLFLKPPTAAWVGGEPLSGDWRYSIVALVLLLIYGVILAVPPLRNFFELYPLGVTAQLAIGLVALEWCAILRLMWRTRFLDRCLGVDLS